MPSIKKHLKHVPAGRWLFCLTAAAAFILVVYFTFTQDWQQMRGSGNAEEISHNAALLREMRSANVPTSTPAPTPAPTPSPSPSPLLAQSATVTVTFTPEPTPTPFNLEAEKEYILALGDVDISSLRRRFKSVAVIGDSVAEDAVTFKWLDKTCVFAKIGASLNPDDYRTRCAAEANKQIYVYTYGTNDIEMERAGYETFIDHYKSVIAMLRGLVLDAQIYVQGIIKPDDWVPGKREYYKYRDIYNEKLQEMCAELGVTYFDVSFILEAYPELYASDGIHFDSKAYGYMLSFIADMVGV